MNCTVCNEYVYLWDVESWLADVTPEGDAVWEHTERLYPCGHEVRDWYE